MPMLSGVLAPLASGNVVFERSPVWLGEGEAERSLGAVGVVTLLFLFRRVTFFFAFFA